MNVERFHLALGQAVALRRTETVIQFALFMAEIERLERECYENRKVTIQYTVAFVASMGKQMGAAPEFKLVDPRRGLYRQMTSKEVGKESGERWKFKKKKGSKPKKAKRCQAKRQKRNRSRRSKRRS